MDRSRNSNLMNFGFEPRTGLKIMIHGMETEEVNDDWLNGIRL